MMISQLKNLITSNSDAVSMASLAAAGAMFVEAVTHLA